LELKIKDGEYVESRYGGFETVSGREETIQRVLMKLSARKGGFFPCPDYGSRLHTLPGMKKSQRSAGARQFVHEALADETDITVGEVTYAEEDGSATVTVELWIDGGESESVTVSI
jgi:phage baseplate assembly protein W